MAPAVEYEIQACSDTYTKHERKQHDYCATEYQSLVNEDGSVDVCLWIGQFIVRTKELGKVLLDHYLYQCM